MYEIVHNNPDYPLVISFQGMSGGVYPNAKDKLPYLYYNLFVKSNLKNNYIFFKDNEQVYYHGLYNKITNIINQYVALHNIKKVITIGQSAGGFASLLVGELIKADKIITIAPQINLKYYSSGSPAKEHIRLFNLQNKFNIPETNLGNLQPFKCQVEYWRPTIGHFDNYHFDFINSLDPNLNLINFKSGHNIGNTIGKEKFKQLILNSIK